MKTQVITGLLLGSLLLTGCEPENKPEITDCKNTGQTRSVPQDGIDGKYMGRETLWICHYKDGTTQEMWIY